MNKLMKVFAAFQKYGPIAMAAVGQVQAEIGASNGDPTVQQSKRSLAIAYVVAAAHAAENVPVDKIQQIAAAVDFAAGIAGAIGGFAKTQKTAAVVVPAGAVLVAK